MAFYNCESMTNVSIYSNNILEIHDRAFEYCGITNVVIESSCTKLGDRVFENCKALNNISIRNISQSKENNI